MKKTIVALATPPGISGLSVIRLSGDEAFEIAGKIFFGNKKIQDSKSHSILYGKIKNENKLIDTVTVSVFIAPNSYTGEDVIEIGCHGGHYVYNEIIDLCIDKGAFLAEPGEFTKRAFLNGKLDLTQVEAVSDIIHANSVPGTHTAARQLDGKFTEKLKILRKNLLDISGLLELELDFIEEDLEFVDRTELKNKILETKNYCLNLADSYKASEIMRSGFFVGITGYPNSGKSTLFNALLDHKRAIVSDIPGTTRDYLEGSIMLGGIAVTLFDTAGIREAKDIIEIEGIKLVDSIMSQANIIFVLNDITESPDNSDNLLKSLKEKYPETNFYYIQNKIDKFASYEKRDDEILVSASEKTNIDLLKKLIRDEAQKSIERVSDVLINARHNKLLRETASALDNALDGIDIDMENEIISIDIRKATKIIGEITGDEWNEEVLAHIFSQFCIGK